ncbi:MAG: SBBP repeat-containing protein [Elusimicrobia bacterium]|nr:SBBP repeat-containing protein [Elusimicrobiota bacterium]
MTRLASSGLLLSLLLPAPARAGELFFHSSAAFDSGFTDQANAVITDSAGNVFVAGVANGSFRLVKYDKRLNQLATRSFDSGAIETARAVAVDASGNVILAGDNASRMLVVKYDASLAFVSSRTYQASGSSEDKAYAVAVDPLGNIYVAGQSLFGLEWDITVAKLTPGLVLLASDRYPNPGGDFDSALGIAVAPSGDVYLAGQQAGANFDFIILKYASGLTGRVVQTLGLPGRQDQALAVAVSSAGTVYVTGQTSPDGSVFDVLTASYEADLTYISSVTFGLGTSTNSDSGRGIAVDHQGNLLVAGDTNAGKNQLLVAKYSPSLVLLASGTRTNGASDVGYAVAVDSAGNPFIAGTTDTGASLDFSIVRFIGPPQIEGVPRVDQGEGFGINGLDQQRTITGDNFVSGSSLTFSQPGLGVRGTFVTNPGELLFNIDVATWVPLGFYDLTITNPDGSSTTRKSALEVIFERTFDSTLLQITTAAIPSGILQLDIPAGTFGANYTLRISTPSSIPDPDPFLTSGIYFEATAAPGPLPNQEILVTVGYRDQDIIGKVETGTLGLNYYDPVLGWQNISTANEPFPGGGFLRAPISHFSMYGVLSGRSSGTGKPLIIYPNPYKPGSSGPFGDPAEGRYVVFSNLPRIFALRLYNVLGEEVFETSGDSVGGKFLWSTNDRNGRPVGSGVYWAIAYDQEGKKLSRGKFSIIR